jgi:hypothetical protein
VLSAIGSWQTGQDILSISLPAPLESSVLARKLIRHERHRIKTLSTSDMVGRSHGKLARPR